MRNILLTILISIFSVAIFSCSTTKKNDEKAKTIQSAKLLYGKYRNMVTEGEGCEACIYCAALSLAISYDTEDEIFLSKKTLLNYYNKNGTIPCPELMPELKKETALVAGSE